MFLFRKRGARPAAVIAVSLFFCTSSSYAAISPPTDTVVSEGFINPVGFYDSTPDFSWKLPAGVIKQESYRIVVASTPDLLPLKPDLWDSGAVISSHSVWIPYAGKSLNSRQKAYWQVKFKDQKGVESSWSKPAYFELGLLKNSDWNAKWIRFEEKIESTRVPVHNIEIIKAVYGAPGRPDAQVDLTEKIRKLIGNGDFIISADNDFAGKDPVYGTKKSLEIEYKIDGRAINKSIAENTTFNIKTGENTGDHKKFIPEYYRKVFDIKGKTGQARLYVTARGLYQVFINGTKISSDLMAPGWTPYHTRIETLTYDVTDQLKRGSNVIGAIIGEGWYAGDMMAKKFVYPEAKPALLLQLEIANSDGSKTVIASDDSWKSCNSGPVRFANIYHGEDYDASMELGRWNETGFDDSSWNAVITEDLDPKVALVPKRHHTVKICSELSVKTITQPVPGRYVFDLGQNMVGRPRLNIPVEKGRQVTIRFAEMLNKDGTLYTDNYRSARSTIFYTPASDNKITWQPVFTFFGFRYVELSGLPDGMKPEKSWITGLVMHSAFDKVGSFSSSHAKLNQLQSNISWGQRGNFLDIPTDCPQRNERLGWTGDAQVFCPTSLFNYDVLAFWMSWLQSVREDRNPQGLIGHTVPVTGCGYGSPGWGDVGVTAPWDVYVLTGNKAVLLENYQMMKDWVAAYERDARGFIVDRKGYGDWLQPYPQGNDNRADTPMEVIATAYFGRCAGIMRKASRTLGHNDDAAKYDKLFKDIQKAFSETFFDKNGRMTTKFQTQTGYLMALGYDLLPEALRAGALTGLLEQIEKADGHLRTGFLGTPLINPVLDRFGKTDIAYSVLFKETYPSWFFSINQGATTMWERWNSYSHKDGFGNAGMNSFNHYAYGAIGQWMYERIAGLAPDPEIPGYKHIYIKPVPGGPLTEAKATHETIYGMAESGWKKTGDSLEITAVIPPNTTATLIVPPTFPDSAVVTESGKECKLIEKDGRMTFSVMPGKHLFVIKAR